MHFAQKKRRIGERAKGKKRKKTPTKQKEKSVVSNGQSLFFNVLKTLLLVFFFIFSMIRHRDINFCGIEVYKIVPDFTVVREEEDATT